MKRIISESKDRKTVYKTAIGIEIKPMLHSKKEGANCSSNITYDYVFYGGKGNHWKVYTNKTLYGETKEIDTFSTKEAAEKAQLAINKAMHLLFENINKK
jgi:hypothetical protein